MTDIMKLIDDVIDYNASDERPRAALQSAIEALQAENERLKLSAKYAEHIDATPENQRETMLHDALTERNALQAKLDELQRQEPQVPAAWKNLLAYVLQDNMHNHLTPRVIDIAYTAFTLAKQPNTEDGGASDWFNDTKPKVAELIKKLHKDLAEELDAAPRALEPMTFEQARKAAQRSGALMRGVSVPDAIDIIREAEKHHGITKGTPCPTCEALARAVMCDNVGKA